MFSSSRCLIQASSISKQVALTFFTKQTCQLCKNARQVLDDTLSELTMKPELKVVDIMKPENSDAFDKYCYDVPVLHVDRINQKKPVKFMHYFDKQDLLKEISRDQ